MPETLITPESEFVLRRTQEAMPPWALLIPVAFALIVLLLVTLFRHERRWSRLLWSGLILAAVSALYLPLGYLFREAFSWYVVLIPVMVIGLVYVALMYRQ